MAAVADAPKLLIFGDDQIIVPLDKIAHVTGLPGMRCRIHLVSFGFVDVNTGFDELMEQIIMASSS